MDEYVGLFIHDQYIKILDRIRNGRLYGETMDMENEEMIVVSAYYLGWSEGQPYLTGRVKKDE